MAQSLKTNQAIAFKKRRTLSAKAPGRKLQDASQAIASEKEKFTLCLEMLKGYYDGLEGRLEKTVGFLLIVVGWLITSGTAREALANPHNSSLFWGAIAVLTGFVILYCLNIAHYLKRFKEVQHTIEQLKYMDEKYFTRYRMPPKMFPVYITPILIFYLFLIVLLFAIRQ